jgi:hypothetical protein
MSSEKLAIKRRIAESLPFLGPAISRLFRRIAELETSLSEARNAQPVNAPPVSGSTFGLLPGLLSEFQHQPVWSEGRNVSAGYS